MARSINEEKAVYVLYICRFFLVPWWSAELPQRSKLVVKTAYLVLFFFNFPLLPLSYNDCFQ